MTKLQAHVQRLHAWLESIFPCAFERGGSVLVIIGIVSTLLFVYTRIAFKHELEGLFQNLMVLSFFISAWHQRGKLKTDTMFRLLVLAILIPWLLFGINALVDYESAVKYRSVNDLAKLMLFLPIAWWVGGSASGARKILIIAFLGLMTAIALDPNLTQSIEQLWSGKRVSFAIHNAQHGALFFGLTSLYCIISIAQRVRSRSDLDRAVMLYLLAALVGLVGLIGTQTRAAYLGMFACGLIALIQLIRRIGVFDQRRKPMAKGVIAAILAAVLLVWSVNEVLYYRLTAEESNVRVLIQGDLDDLPFKGIGIRIHSWVESLDWIAEKPVTGWGPKARSDVIQLAAHFPDDMKIYGHLHNGYLELALGFGVVGLAFVFVLWIVTLRRIRLAASSDLYAFALYGSVFFLVMNLFESFFFYWSGEFALALFMAGGYSQYLARSLGNGLPEKTDAGSTP